MASWARLVAMDGERSLGGVGRWEQRRREGGWNLMISCARATRGLRRMRREPPDHPSCSQNAHDETVLVRCAQLQEPYTPLPIGLMKKLNWTCFVGGVLVCAWSLFPSLTLAA